MRDKEKILMLVTLIIFIVVLLLSFIVITYFNIKEENKVPKHDKTTIQESTTTKESTTETTTKIVTEAVTEITTTKTSSTKVTTTATKKITTKGITTKGITTTTEEIVSIVNPSELDEWCLNIFNIINDTRKNNGLNILSLKKDIRDLAIDASIKWESIHDEGLKSYLYGYNYYGYQSNILSSNNGYKVIANETLKNTDVGTNKYLNYVGININKVDNKYYFIIIYE